MTELNPAPESYWDERTAETYHRAILECHLVAGLGDTYWNDRFRSALKARGLTLALPPPRILSYSMYPEGYPYTAPLPSPGSINPWLSGSLIVWSP